MLVDYGVKGLGHFYLAALAALAALSAAYVFYLVGFSAGRAHGRKELAEGLAETLSVEGPDSVLKTIKSGVVVPFEDMTSRPDTSDGGW